MLVTGGERASRGRGIARRQSPDRVAPVDHFVAFAVHDELADQVVVGRVVALRRRVQTPVTATWQRSKHVSRPVRLDGPNAMPAAREAQRGACT